MSKRYSPRFKFQVVMEATTNSKKVVQTARAYDVHPNTVKNWINEFKEKGPEIFSKKGTVNDLEQKISELERLLGRKEREIALLKNFFGKVK